MIDDLRHFRSDISLQRRVFATLFATACIMLIPTVLYLNVHQTIAAPQASPIPPHEGSPTPPVTAQPAEAATISVVQMQRFIAGCMNHAARLEWTDPHTGLQMALFCENYSFPVAE